MAMCLTGSSIDGFEQVDDAKNEKRNCASDSDCDELAPDL